jgi:hypothetical protein
MVARGSGVSVPASHSSHRVAGSLSWSFWPEGHSVQASAAAGEYVPNAHCVQTVDALPPAGGLDASSSYFPAAQSVHAAYHPAGVYVPAGQSRQSVEPDSVLQVVGQMSRTSVAGTCGVNAQSASGHVPASRVEASAAVAQFRVTLRSASHA